MRRAARGYVIDHSILITPREPPAFPPSDPMHLLAESARRSRSGMVTSVLCVSREHRVTCPRPQPLSCVYCNVSSRAVRLAEEARARAKKTDRRLFLLLLVVLE